MTKINLNQLSAINRNMAIALLIATTAPVTTATAHTAMSTYAAAVNAAADDEGNTGIITGVTSIKGIDDIMGLTYDDIKALAVKVGEFNEEDMSKIIFIYNVKTKMFLNAGGFWGTHVSLKDYPLPLWVNTIKGETALQLVQNMDTGEGKQLGWERVSSVLTEVPDRGVFIDRDDSYGWEFEAVGDMKNSYRLYTYRYQIGMLEKRYLCANKGSVDQDKNCEGMEDKDINKNGLQGYDQWRVFTMEQILNLQKLNSDNMTSSTSRSNCCALASQEEISISVSGIRFSLENEQKVVCASDWRRHITLNLKPARITMIVEITFRALNRTPLTSANLLHKTIICATWPNISVPMLRACVVLYTKM